MGADHSCRAAVARLLARRVAKGQSPCSAATGAYRRARKRLPEKFFSDVARQTGRALQAGVDCVCRFTSHRTADFRRGKRLGPGDHIVKWLKPRKPRSTDAESYDPLPEFLMIRETRVRVAQAGFRS